MMPRFTIECVRQQLDTTFPTATAAVTVLEDLGIAAEMTGQKKTQLQLPRLCGVAFSLTKRPSHQRRSTAMFMGWVSLLE